MPGRSRQWLLLAGLVGFAPVIQAGAFIFAGETWGNDVILHPKGYTGTGGQIELNVCIVSGTANEASMQQSVKNIIAVYNQLLPTTGNLRLNFLASGLLDFESVALHELGHCLGEAHVNAASESGLTGSNQNYTKATDGNLATSPDVASEFNLGIGADGVRGSGDDVRGDDVNLHWFRTANNNPFTIDYATIDSTTYARDTASLPGTDSFAANADRTVGASRLSTPNTEAVMQQGTFSREIQRTLTPDGVATLKYAMSGLDEIAGNSDDYTFHLNLATSACDINLQFSTSVGLAFCSVGGTSITSGHWRITSGEIFFGEEFTWFFNTAAPCSKTLALTQNQWAMFTLPCSVGISAGNTVADVLGDDLTGTYDTNWVVYERDAGNNVYTKLATTDAMSTGRGYWVFTDQAGQSFNVQGQFNGSPDILLHGAAGGRANLVGHPFDFSMAWADVQIVDGAQVQTLAAAVTDGDLSETYHVWNGNAYNAFDASTAGMIGTLAMFDGMWVKAFKDGIYLRVPSSTPSYPASSSAVVSSITAEITSLNTKTPQSSGKEDDHQDEDDDKKEDEPWYVRVIVESGDFQDSGNVLGQLPDSLDGRDRHDLEELEPFGDAYLTVVFPHDDWDGDAWGYTSDFHAGSHKPQGEWIFAVLSSIGVEQISLRLEGPHDILRKAKLRDLDTGRKIKFTEGAYTFDASPGVRYFSFEVRNKKKKKKEK